MFAYTSFEKVLLPQTLDKNCQTEEWQMPDGAVKQSGVSVAVATHDIEQCALLQHDHSYMKWPSPSHQNKPVNNNNREEENVSDDEETAHMDLSMDSIDCGSISDDPDFCLSDSDADSSDSCSEPCAVRNACPLDDIKFIVFKLKLLELFTLCHWPGCGRPVIDDPKLRENGFAITIVTECVAGHVFSWDGHPKVNNVFAGNLLIPSALFVTGGSYTSFIETCNTIHLKALSVRQCCNIQRAYMVPEVTKMWTQHTEAILASVSESSLEVSGDGRCDTPGHCATFGTYTLLDVNSHLITGQETVRYHSQ